MSFTLQLLLRVFYPHSLLSFPLKALWSDFASWLPNGATALSSLSSLLSHSPLVGHLILVSSGARLSPSSLCSLSIIHLLTSLVISSGPVYNPSDDSQISYSSGTIYSAAYQISPCTHLKGNLCSVFSNQNHSFPHTFLNGFINQQKQKNKTKEPHSSNPTCNLLICHIIYFSLLPETNLVQTVTSYLDSCLDL